MIDYDPDAGCDVNGVSGVDVVLVTQVTEGDTARVTRTHREVCSAGVLGAPTAIDTTGWNAGWNPVSKFLSLETRIPFSAIQLPESTEEFHDVIAYFDASRNGSVHTSVANQDGTAIVIPRPPVRRRAIGVGGAHQITLDGALLDWGKIKPAVAGLASNGTDSLRLLRILAWPDTGDDHVYFAATAYLGSDFPYADDNTYLRQPGENLMVGAADGILKNDAHPGTAKGVDLNAVQVSEPQRGTVVLNSDGSFTYSPDHPQLLNDDEFEYKAVGRGKESNVARVIIKMNQGETPNPPQDDQYETNEDKNLTRLAPGVLANDFENPSVLEAILVTPPQHGTVTLNKDGGFTYKPAANYFGDDTFVYDAVKKQGAPNGIGGEATVTIEIHPVNDAPTFNAGPSPVTVTIGSGAYSQVWATNVKPGPPNESGQSVQFLVSNNNNALFAVQPSIAPNGTLTFTPGPNPGTAVVSVQLKDNGGLGRGGVDTSPTVTFTINVTCGTTITVTNPSNANGTANAAFSETFTQSGGVGAVTFSLGSGTLPAGLTLDANGVLSGTPTQTGSFPITVTATDSNGCPGTGPTYNLVIACQTITVTSPANGNGTAGAAFSETFTQAGAIGTATFSLASGTLPAGLTLAANGVLSGTPTQTGSFPITVTATDSNGCTGTSTTYTIVIGCQTITVNNPANGNGTVSAPFSETFTQTGAIGTATFTLASGTLPAGLTLAANGVLSGTPLQTGSFPITVTVTDSNGCTGTSGTYTITIGCQTITVNNPSNATGTVNAAFSETFTQSNAVGGATFTLASGVLPAGLTLATNGTLSGSPTEDGSFPITVTVTDGNGCTGTSATYNLVINCQTMTVNNPANATGPAGSPFSETFTQTGGVLPVTFTLASGTLPTGLALAPSGVLSGTPTQGGTFPITVTATDANGCTSTGGTYTLVITCPVITVNNPANGNGTANSPFSETFTSSGGVGAMTYTLDSGTLPAGLTLAANGVLSGTPTQTGSFPITVTATDSNGCTGTGMTYTIVIACQTITVTNPANGNGTAGSAFSETFTETGSIGTATFTLASGTLPTGLTLASNGVLSGTPTQTGSFPITVTATDSNGCTGTGMTYTIVIACQTITVNNPANGNGIAGSPFSETFTAPAAIGTTTFTLASGVLPAGLTLAANGTVSGTPLQTGSFPITVTATDANGCTGTSSTYTITIGCQTITVSTSGASGGAANSPFSMTFTQTGAIGTATFTTASTLPTGLTLSTAGVLSGTPTQTGSFPITVTVTDSNGCTGSTMVNLVFTCQTITVNNPANATGPAGSPFSETFTATNAIGTETYTLASGTLPTGLALAPNGVLSGTPMQGGTFPITVTVTDSNGCTGTGATYNLTITCPTITVNNPANGNGTANSPFSETFTSTGGVGTMTYTLDSGTLPAGLTLAANGTLSGTPTQTGSFPITVLATDQNGCTGTGSTYTIVIACQTITVNNPANGNGTANAPFSETFTATNAIGTTTYTLASGTLPAGLTLGTNGTVSGTPTQTGSFPITVTATDANGCTGTSATYTIVIACQVITVNNPANGNGTAGAPFSETFTATNAIGTTTFTLASGTLPTGLTLAANGTLSGTPLQTGSFPITVTVTDANGCTGTSATYTITIACQTITVTSPANASGTVNAPFSETFTQTGAIGTATFTTASTLPAGLTLAANGVLSGTPTQSGTFPIVVTVTDSNGCTGTSSTYNLTIACQTITVTNPGVTTGTAGTAFSQMFTQSGAVGTATFTTASTLPAGLMLQTDGTLTGTPTEVGTFPIVVTVTDSNGCTGTSATYNLVIGCQTITITNPATDSVQAGQAFSATFTATPILGTPNWTLESGTLPTGITLNAATGELSGTSTQLGSFPITVRVTDTPNGCFDISDTYTLTVTCPVITVARNGGGAFPAATFNAAYVGQSVVASGGTSPYTYTLASGALPTGLTLNPDGTITGTPTATGTFNFDVTATDANTCAGTQSFSIAVNPTAAADNYVNLVNNTQAYVSGGTTAAPGTPHVVLTGLLIANDLPSGGVAVVPGTVATTQGGSVTIAADGSFVYTPPVTVNALATDSFTYTIVSNTGGTGTPTQAIGTATLNLAGRVWYVKNDGPNGDGRSHSPFNSTAPFVGAARSGPDKPGDTIYVYRGDGTTTNHTSGVVLLDNEHLIGEGVALVVNTHTLRPAGLQPQLTLAAGNVVDLGNGNTVRGLTLTGGANGIAGAGKTAFTGGDLTLQNNTAAGIVLNTFAGAVTLTNTTIANNGIGVNLAAGTPTFTMDNTNSITANAGQRSINFNALGATAVATVGATITDNGTGISVTNSVAGAAISFTGSQTLSTGANAAVTLTTNTGATITFGGSLSATTTTGSGFTATGGGTLIVGAGGSSAGIVTGAAAAALNLNGMTIGAGGVTFDTVNATGATTAISLVNVNGLVTVDGGSINNVGTGVNLQGASTSLTLAGVSIGGTTTTGITNTTNFGTLTIGGSVSVAGATALNLTTGTVTGTFANVTSSGGTNGVNLNAVSGVWGATAGSLSGAAGATFNVSGTAAAGSAITWGGTITQNNAATAVTISSHNRNVTFSGSITTGGTSTGISIASSSGTYLFNGTNTIAGSGGGIAIGLNTSGTITFSNNSSINTAGTAFSVAGGGGAVTAAITYGGTITKNSGGVLISVDNLDAPGTLSMTHTPSAAGNISQNSNGANGISIINSSSTNITIENASVTFNNTAAGFTASGNTGGTINLPGLALTGTGNKAGMLISGAGTINVNAGAANPSINLSGGTNAASRAIDGATAAFTGTLNLTNVTITGNANADIVNLGGGTLGGTGSTISGPNRALVLSGVALTNGAGMTSIASTGGANGISLTNVTGGTYTVGSGGNLSGNTGSAFLVSGSSATFSYAGTITQNTGGQRAVNISGVTGGTITLSGAIGSNGGTGVTVAGTGGTVAITGTMTLSGTGSVFTVSGAGLTITAPSNTNVVGSPTAATSTPVSITNSTIGAAGVTFQSVSANGAANGIVLSGTGASGAFLVRGDNTLARNGSGGTINNTTGDAIQLTNANSVTIQSMNLTSNGSNPATAADAAGTGGNHTVQISGGGNIVLSGVYVDASDGSGYVLLNATGTNRINNNSRFENTPAGAGHSVYVNNTNTNMTLFEVNNTQFVDNNATHTNFFVANTGTSNMAVTVQNNCLFEDLGTQAITAAAGGTAATTGTLTTSILNNDFQNAKGLGENNVGILVINGANHVANVQGNLFENIAKDGTIANTSIIRTQNSGGDMTATVTGNTIQNIAYAAGFGGRHVIGHVFEPVSYNAGDSSTLFFTSNTISNVTYPALGNNREAIFIDYRTTASGGEVTVQGNNINMPTSGAQQAMELRFRQTNASSVNVLVRGNTVTHNTAAAMLDVDVEDSANVQLTIDGANNFTNSNGTPGSTIAVSTEDPVAAGGPPTACVSITGNTLQGGAGTISLDETAGTMNVTQASAAAVASANGIPGGNVTTSGTPSFGQPACTLP